MKGTAKAITNIKPMDGGVTIAQLQVGDYAFGTVGATDLMNFSHFYRKDNSIVQLGKPCKAYLGNLTTSSDVEPAVEPPPVDPPVDPAPVEPPITLEIEGKRMVYKFEKYL
jgi:hypothetical protein